jgi:hypothetical protein
MMKLTLRYMCNALSALATVGLGVGVTSHVSLPKWQRFLRSHSRSELSQRRLLGDRQDHGYCFTLLVASCGFLVPSLGRGESDD